VFHTCETAVPSVGEVPWPPRIGEPLPRADDVWCEQRKLEWILGSEGHGSEWERVFRAKPVDRALFWQAIARTALDSEVQDVRERPPHGIACETQPMLILNRRSSLAIVSWHLPFEGSAPRLVTAYPTP
jgi:hypothetical protein